MTVSYYNLSLAVIRAVKKKVCVIRKCIIKNEVRVTTLLTMVYDKVSHHPLQGLSKYTLLRPNVTLIKT